jgi:hypothetical protein
MAEKSSKPAKSSKIKTIYKIYGTDSSSATLEETSAFLKRKGYKSLGDLLQPAK